MAKKKGYLDFDKIKTRRLFISLGKASSEDEKDEIRDQLVKEYLSLLEYLARRFRGRDYPLEDLVQVGSIGLLKAIDRFDLNKGWEFTTYAVPKIIGEIKRYFRDHGWNIRLPSRLKETCLEISKVTDKLFQELGRMPRIKEIADCIHLTEDEVIEAMSVSESRNFVSLDGKRDSVDKGKRFDGAFSLDDYLGKEDLSYETIENREALRKAIKCLYPREQKIIYLKFFEDLTQTQIAEMLNISQMHVSRLIRQILPRLREKMMFNFHLSVAKSYNNSPLLNKEVASVLKEELPKPGEKSKARVEDILLAMKCQFDIVMKREGVMIR